MMTSLSLASTLPADTGRARLPGTLRSEWTKILTVRSTVWSIAFMAGIAIGANALINWLSINRHWAQMSAEDRAGLLAQPLDQVLAGPMSIIQFGVAVLGVMAISSEYATGMIRSTLQAQPRRFTVLTAKILVLGALMLAVGEALAFAAFGVGKAVISAYVPIHLDDPGVLRALVGAGLYTAVLALFSLAAGAIFRHTAGGITAVLGLITVISPLTSLLPDTWGHYVNAYMPTDAGSLVFQQFVAPEWLLGPWQGIGVFAAATALLLLLSAYLLRRRDA
jgi:ABC-type transport system involved in multi-copper enzyme maturation permease subunit